MSQGPSGREEGVLLKQKSPQCAKACRESGLVLERVPHAVFAAGERWAGRVVEAGRGGQRRPEQHEGTWL